MGRSTLLSDFSRQLLIGLEVKIVGSTNPGFKSIQGRVIDETRNMLVIQRPGKITKVPKDTAIFRFKLQNGAEVQIDGRNIVGRPEDRLKKNRRRLRDGEEHRT